MCKTGKYGFVLVSCLMLLFASGCSAGTGTGEMQSGAQSDAVCLADAAGIHRYEKTVVEPTCTEAGYTQFICGCGASIRDERVLPTGHRYEGYIVEPTYAAEGYTRHVCSVCEAWYTDTYVL